MNADKSVSSEAGFDSLACGRHAMKHGFREAFQNLLICVHLRSSAAKYFFLNHNKNDSAADERL
jgi:hypothetical protein